jgi:hypothetical protein
MYVSWVAPLPSFYWFYLKEAVFYTGCGGLVKREVQPVTLRHKSKAPALFQVIVFPSLL